MSSPPLVLASSSPRRAAILEMLGLAFDVRPGRVPEALLDETASEHAERLCREKARVVADERPGALVLAGDTVVVLDDEVVGKPDDGEAAAEMLRALSGRSHEVVTGLALASPDGVLRSGLSRTRVWFRNLAREDVRDYVATGEPLDKAGAYGIQGRGGALVSRIEGDYYAVVGLPLALFASLLADAGWRYAFGLLERTTSSTEP